MTIDIKLAVDVKLTVDAIFTIDVKLTIDVILAINAKLTTDVMLINGINKPLMRFLLHSVILWKGVTHDSSVTLLRAVSTSTALM